MEDDRGVVGHNNVQSFLPGHSESMRDDLRTKPIYQIEAFLPKVGGYLLPGPFELTPEVLLELGDFLFSRFVEDESDPCLFILILFLQPEGEFLQVIGGGVLIGFDRRRHFDVLAQRFGHAIEINQSYPAEGSRRGSTCEKEGNHTGQRANRRDRHHHPVKKISPTAARTVCEVGRRDDGGF